MGGRRGTAWRPGSRWNFELALDSSAATSCPQPGRLVSECERQALEREQERNSRSQGVYDTYYVLTMHGFQSAVYTCAACECHGCSSVAVRPDRTGLSHEKK